MFQYERVALDQFLQTLDYPQDREHVIQAAKETTLPPAAFKLLQRLDDKQYDSAQDVEDDLRQHRA